MELLFGHQLNGRAITSAGVSNQHLFVSGISGSGKSYCLQGLAEQAVRQQAHVIIFDYTGDFAVYDPPADIPFCKKDVRNPELQFNPLAAVSGESPFLRTQRLVNILCTAYPRLGGRARLALLTHVPDYLETHSHATIPGLIQYLSDHPSAKGTHDACELLNALTVLTGNNDAPLRLDLNRPGLLVLDFAQVETGWMRKLLIEVLLRVVWDQRIGSETAAAHPLILLLDECQGLGWSDDSMAVRILREGRKFGIAGWFGTQWVSSKTAATALKQAGTRLYFRQDHDAATALASALAGGDSTKARQLTRIISTLQTGDFVTQNTHGRIQTGHVPARAQADD